MVNRTWIHGPDILWGSKFPLEFTSLSVDDIEVKRSHTVSTVIVKYYENPTNKLLMYFSSWRKLKVAVAWLLKLKETFEVLIMVWNRR